MRKEARSFDEIFADVLAETGDIRKAGAAAGISNGAAQMRFSRMCRKLGGQAK